MYSRSNNPARHHITWAIRLMVLPALLSGAPAHADKLPELPKLSEIRLPKLPEMPKLPHNLQIHGFASQGWLKSTDNNVFGQSSSSSGSFDFREIGLNASMRPLSNLQFSVQGLSRTAGEGSPGNIRLDYGFIDYTFSNQENSQFGIRLGRMKNPLGFYNDTRDVPFTRPSILLPQSIYFDRTRKLAIAADGAHLYGEYRSDYGDVSFQAGVVRPLVQGAEAEAAVFNGYQPPGHLTPNMSYVGRVNYELDGGRVRFGISATQLNMGYSPSPQGLSAVPPRSFRRARFTSSLWFSRLNTTPSAGASPRNTRFASSNIKTLARRYQTWTLLGRAIIFRASTGLRRSGKELFVTTLCSPTEMTIVEKNGLQMTLQRATRTPRA